MKLVKLDKCFYNIEEIKWLSPRINHPDKTTINGSFVISLPINEILDILQTAGVEITAVADKTSYTTRQRAESWGQIYDLLKELGMSLKWSATPQEQILGYIEDLHKELTNLRTVTKTLKQLIEELQN